MIRAFAHPSWFATPMSTAARRAHRDELRQIVRASWPRWAVNCAVAGSGPPVLMLHGGADGIISPEATKQFYAAAASTDKQMKIYEGMYHEICNEVGREHVFADITLWLERHLDN